MKYDCALIQDLIPLVKDGIASDVSKAVVELHIQECALCKGIHDADAHIDFPSMDESASAEITKVNEYKSRIRKWQKKIASKIVLTTLVLSFAVFSFFFLAQKPQSHDSDRAALFTVEIQLYMNYIDKELWLETYDYHLPAEGEVLTMSTDGIEHLHTIVGSDYDLSMGRSELRQWVYHKDNIYFISRDLVRNGETITVVYYYLTNTRAQRFYYERLYWESQAPKTVNLVERAAGDALKLIEVYYLRADFNEMGQFDDELYDAERLNAECVWLGLI